MADEITITYGLRVNKGGVSVQVPTTQQQYDMTGSRRCSNTQNIGTTQEVLVTGDLATAGYGLFINLDATNFVEIGIVSGGTFYPTIKLLPGQIALAPLATLAIYAKADTAAVDLDYELIEA